MRLRFLAIDPNMGDDRCSAVSVDEGTGDLVFQGRTVTDAQVLADVEALRDVGDPTVQ